MMGRLVLVILNNLSDKLQLGDTVCYWIAVKLRAYDIHDILSTSPYKILRVLNNTCMC